jgi:HK97 family phage major capsid protein
MTATIPDTVEGFEETLANPSRLGDYFREGRPTAEFGEFVKGYAKTLTAKTRDLHDDAIRAQVEEVFAELLAKHNPEDARRLNFDPAVPPQRMSRNASDRYRQVYNVAAPGAQADSVANVNLGRLVQATYHTPNAIGQREHLGQIENDIRRVMNAFGSGVPADGGLLIPETLRAEILTVAMETALVRPRARVIPMDSLRVPFPILDITDNSASVFGGVQAYWTEEAADYTESSPKFGRVVLDAKKLTARADVPDELIQDSILALNAWISTAYPQAVAWYEDLAYIRGTGVGEPLGWNGSGNTALVTVAKESGQPANTIVWENIVKMYSRMFPGSHGSAVWVANPNAFPELATMALSVGTGGSAIWLNNGTDGPPATILGRPLILSEKMETLGTAGDLAYVDLSYYLVGDRMAMTMAASEHAKFTSGQTVIKTTMRVDGAPAVKSSIIPNKGGSGSALSPFVRLATRA